MLYDPDADKVVRLNGTARRIFEMCTGIHTLDDISAALQKQFQIDPTIDVRQQVKETIAQFAAAGLLTGVPESAC